MLGGIVASEPQSRTSPAGVPISRFLLRHHSEQLEAGMKRHIECALGVVAAGSELQGVIKRLHQGSEVRVSGYLGSSRSRDNEYRLVLHATGIELAGNAP